MTFTVRNKDAESEDFLYQKSFNRQVKSDLTDIATELSNKVTDFTTIDNITYPTTEAVNQRIVQSLTGYSSFFFYITASDIATYYAMLPDPSTGSSQNITVNNVSGTTTIAVFATESGEPNKVYIPIGFFRTHFHAKKTGGGNAKVYAEIYKRNLAGTETLLATTPLTISDLTTSILEYNLDVYNDALITLLATDRLVYKWIAVVTSGTPDISIYFEDAYLSRLDIPSPSGSSTSGGGGSTGSSGSQVRTQIVFTGTTTSGTTITLSASGATWTKSGTTPNLGVDATTFNNDLFAQVEANGIPLIKGTEVTWISDSSIQLNRNYVSGERLLIYTSNTEVVDIVSYANNFLLGGM